MKYLILLFTATFSLTSVFSQTGPWAKYDARMKGEALVREADGGYVKEMQSIIDGGGDVDWQLQSGATPLMVAAASGRTEAVKLLLKAGANPNLKDVNGWTAMDRARMSGANDIVKLLADVGTQVPPVKQDPIIVPAPPATPTVPVPAIPPVKQEPIIVQTPPTAPTVPASPASPVKQDPTPTTPAPVITTTTTARLKWAPFTTYKIGDEVSFFNGRWNRGRIKEVGPIGDYNSKNVRPGERKYLISREGAYNWNDWTDWGQVTGLTREDYWTNFFLGDWKLGEVMAMTTQVEGGNQRDHYSFHAATEALQVMADKSYRWKPMGGKVISGKWKPAEDGAGIILLKGFQGLDWTLRNETNAAEENIRGLETSRLTTPGKMSIKAVRPL